MREREVFVFVRRGGEFLVLHRSPDQGSYWHGVAGGVEEGETWAEAAAEEIGEVLRDDGYSVAVEAEPAHWLLTARGDVRVDSFDVAERALTALAESRGGRYAGCRREPAA